MGIFPSDSQVAIHARGFHGAVGHEQTLIFLLKDRGHHRRVGRSAHYGGRGCLRGREDVYPGQPEEGDGKKDERADPERGRNTLHERLVVAAVFDEGAQVVHGNTMKYTMPTARTPSKKAAPYASNLKMVFAISQICLLSSL